MRRGFRRRRGRPARPDTATDASQTPPAQPQPPDLPTPRFRTEADVVVVEATVLDRKGAIVGGLGAADFKVEIWRQAA